MRGVNSRAKQAKQADHRLTLMCSSLVIHHFTADHSHDGARLEDLSIGHLHDVRGKQGKIGALPDLDGASILFLEGGERWPNRKHLKGLLARYPLLAVP